MNTLISKQLYAHLFTIAILVIFGLNNVAGQIDIPFEVEEHFEIHNDPDIGILLMPEQYCENSSSEDFGFVFKRKIIEINTGAPFPPPGQCGDFFGDPVLEFYPEDFNGFGFVNSHLGTTANPWTTLDVRRITLDGNFGSIRGPFNSLYANHIILPGGRNILQEGDNLTDDGVIFSPGGLGNTSDIVMWSNDDIVMNFKSEISQTDGQFAVTEEGPTNIKFKVGTGGTIFMPDLPETTSFVLPIVVFDPTDGQLYHQFLSSNLTSESNDELKATIQSLQEDNQELRSKIEGIINQYERQAKEIQNLKHSVSKSQSND